MDTETADVERTDLPSPPEPRRRPRVRELRAGDLTPNWALAFLVTWGLIGGSLGAVWYSSRITGLATWWLGPESDPRWWFHVVPFVAPLLTTVLAMAGARHLPRWGIGAAVVTALVAVGDVGTVTGYAVVEFALAGAGFAVSLAATVGSLRDE